MSIIETKSNQTILLAECLGTLYHFHLHMFRSSRQDSNAILRNEKGAGFPLLLLASALDLYLQVQQRPAHQSKYRVAAVYKLHPCVCLCLLSPCQNGKKNHQNS